MDFEVRNHKGLTAHDVMQRRADMSHDLLSSFEELITQGTGRVPRSIFSQMVQLKTDAESDDTDSLDEYEDALNFQGQ